MDKQLPPKLNGDKEGTFAYKTIKDRWPKIITKLVDSYKRNMNILITRFGKDSEDDIRSIMEGLSKLRYLIMTDKPLTNFSDNYHDSQLWNSLLSYYRENEGDSDKLTWYHADWLFAECYLYRTIYGFSYSTKYLRDFDYFESNKQENFTDHSCQIEESCDFLLKIVTNETPVETDIGLNTLIKISLWGNRADMSLTGGEKVDMTQSAIHTASKRDEFILVDDINRCIKDYLLSHRKQNEHRRIDIVLDNAGVELIGDLLLCEYLLSVDLADKIVLHAKCYPWFVSDVTEKDFSWTLNSLKMLGNQSKLFGERLDQRITSKQLELKSHPFWTYPHPYCEMKNISPDLYQDLEESAFIFFKGDLNYRKLVGDRDWDYTTSFNVACNGFQPSPFIALRTLKSETVCGFSTGIIRMLNEKYDDNTSWMVSGEYAVCQLSN